MINNNNNSSADVKNSSTVETWRPVVGYEGLYEVSDKGNVKSLSREVIRKDGIKIKISERLLKITKSETGYCTVNLSKNGESYCFGVHVLVAHAFVPGYDKDNANEVNHLNEDKHDNRACNLEWCNRKYNLNYGGYKERMSISCGGSGLIKQYDLQGNLVAEYPSIKEASRQTGINVSSIHGNINGNIKRGYTRGYRFVG